MFNDFLHLIFPETCVACDEVLPKGKEHLCHVCTQLLPFAEINSDETFRKLAGRVDVEAAFAYLKFNKTGIVQKLLHNLKYNNNPELGHFIGREFGSYLKDQNIELPKDGLIPVPLHPSRQKERGYNQAEVIANGLAESSGSGVSVSYLKRIKESISQTKKGRAARLTNMSECFSLNEKTDIKGLHVGLVDDVITTGATIEACCLCLKAAGVGKITVFTIANA